MLDASNIPDYQSRGLSWNPLRDDIEELLATAAHSEVRPIYYGSNHCFLVTLDAGASGKSLAVYKPARGEYPLYDFPCGTLYRREYGSWIVCRMLDWWLVPPTVVTDGRYGTGSLQLFIEAQDDTEVEVDELRRLALLDIVLNNADRKPDHLLVGDGGKLWGIDHGLTFHVQQKLRTIVWHFAGSRLRRSEHEDLGRLADLLTRRRDHRVQLLDDLISRSEMRALLDRVERLAGMGTFPDPRYKAVPYRW